MGLFHHLGHVVDDESLATDPPTPEVEPPSSTAGGGGELPSGELARQDAAEQAARAQHDADVAREVREHREDRAAQQHQWDVENARADAATPADAPADTTAAAAAVPSPYPTPPAQQRALEAGAAPGPGGVVPYEGGGVRVGMPREVAHTIAAKPLRRK